MKTRDRALLFLTMGVSFLSGDPQAKRPVTPRDCVTVRYLFTDNSAQRSIQLNPQSTRVAYLVKSPNLVLNQNDIQLYVKDVTENAGDSPRMLLAGTSIAELEWLADGKHIVVLAKAHGRASVVQVDTATGHRKVLARVARDIREYSIDDAGDVLVFATEEPNRDQTEMERRTSTDIAQGYRISFQSTPTGAFPRRRLFVTRKRRNAMWSAPQPISVLSPFTRRPLMAFPYLTTLHLSLSPNGRSVLVNYVDDGEQMPATWKASPYVQLLRKNGFPGILPTLLIDLVNGNAKLAVDSPWISNSPLWSKDSKSFVVSAVSPAGSRWENDDTQNGRIGAEQAHLFQVEAETGKTTFVALRAADGAKQPLFWSRAGALVLHTVDDKIAIYSQRNGQWTRDSSFPIPLPDNYRFAELASDGSIVVGDYQNATTPPEIFRFAKGQNGILTIARLNPQFDLLTLAPVQKIQWETSTGFPIEGFLFTPPAYIAGKRYPLVIQTKPDEGQFVCDTGQNHYPSFAPQPIANAGILYLIRTYPPTWKQKDEEAHYPKGYPGGIAEAAFQADVWESAIKSLDERGFVDPAKVGIIGFSRSGWYTEFALTNSSIRYKAATLADNVQYSVSEYWLLHSQGILRGWDSMYGGPPYGSTLKNWTDFSISFNVDKIRTPILMEEMGYGVPYDNAKAPPLNLADKWDLYTGLVRLKKPVELYYYPNEGHQPDHPQARLATLQRNLDWYRFWLEDYERPSPSDPEQYIRWRSLKTSPIHSDKKTVLSPSGQDTPTHNN